MPERLTTSCLILISCREIRPAFGPSVLGGWALIFARKKSRAVAERCAHLAVSHPREINGQMTRDSFLSPRDGDAPHLPSVTNYPAPLRHPRAESRLMSYSRERDPLVRKKRPLGLPREERTNVKKTAWLSPVCCVYICI